MSLAEFALKRPYTIISSLMLICIMGIGAGLRMPVDIFPEIDIPVVSVVWTYAGMSPQDIQNRILTLHERQLASLVDDIARIEATSCDGVAVRRPGLGPKDRGRLDAGGCRRRPRSFARHSQADAAGRRQQGDFRSVAVRQSFAEQRFDRRRDGGGTDSDDDSTRMFFLVSRVAAVDALYSFVEPENCSIDA
jgi:hypothetical protein